MKIESMYYELIEDITNELLKIENFELVDFIRDRMISITEMEDAYMDSQVSILENQSPEC